jgi:protein TonB
VTFPIDSQVYLPQEIADAAGVSVDDVVAALDGYRGFVAYDRAVAVGLTLRRMALSSPVPSPVLPQLPFTLYGEPSERSTRRVPFAVSGTVHAALISAAILATSFTIAPSAGAPPEVPENAPHLVFLNVAGPGGGGGGGGRLQAAPPRKALRSGHQRTSSAVPERAPAPPVRAPAVEPPLVSRDIPTVTAPVIPSPADDDDQVGVLEQTVGFESKGSGAREGVGSGRGTGVGSGDGSGLGQGSGGGTGGGPYRPGAGITPPRLLQEVKPTYTDTARRAGITGEVVLEVVIRRDGTVGDVRVKRGLDRGLDERAVDAVRRWRFAPAVRQGVAVDILVEVSVEFSLR